MTTYRLRSQLFIAALLIVLGLAGSILLFIRHTVNIEVERNIRDGTKARTDAFVPSRMFLSAHGKYRSRKKHTRWNECIGTRFRNRAAAARTAIIANCGD